MARSCRPYAETRVHWSPGGGEGDVDSTVVNAKVDHVAGVVVGKHEVRTRWDEDEVQVARVHLHVVAATWVVVASRSAASRASTASA